MSKEANEKHEAIEPTPLRSSLSVDNGKVEQGDDAFEVFKRGDGNVDFRTVGWVHASVIFLKGKTLLRFP
jgi:hypothetical protein